jgi:hypothetical protein
MPPGLPTDTWNSAEEPVRATPRFRALCARTAREPAADAIIPLD